MDSYGDGSDKQLAAMETQTIENAPLEFLGKIAFMADLEGLDKASYFRVDWAAPTTNEDEQSQNVRVALAKNCLIL